MIILTKTSDFDFGSVDLGTDLNFVRGIRERHAPEVNSDIVHSKLGRFVGNILFSFAVLLYVKRDRLTETSCF